MGSIRHTGRLTAATAFILLTIMGQSQAADFMDSKCRDFRKSFSIDKRTLERPQPPFCTTMFGQFDEPTFNSCRSEMETYRNKIAKFTDCLVDENDRATEEFNTAVGNFNRRVGQ